MADWKNELDDVLRQKKQQQQERTKREQQERMAVEQNREKAIEFVKSIVDPAFRELEKELHKHGTTANVLPLSSTSVTIHVPPFQYSIDVGVSVSGVYPEVTSISGSRYTSNRSILKDGRVLSIDEITKDDIKGRLHPRVQEQPHNVREGPTVSWRQPELDNRRLLL